VTTGWLAERLGEPGLVVVDATVFPVAGGYVTGDEKYLLEGHIPGALFADLIDDFSDPEGRFPFTRPDAARFAAAAGALGIGPGTAVVVYDAALGQWASRLWWLLRSFGHDRAAVLDGGLTAWLAEGRPVETGHVEAAPAVFVAQERPELWIDKAGVERILAGEESATLVCATPPGEFAGAAGSRPRAGHIPGSVSVPAGRLVDPGTRVFLEEEGLRTALAPALGGRVVAYCGGGIAATAAAFALALLGEEDVAVYDGSLNEWAADPDAPLVTSA